MCNLKGFLRADGKKGIRNVLLVCYLVECAKFVAEQIVKEANDKDVQLIGFSGCFPNDYAFDVLKAVCTHANVGAVLLVSLGCESFEKSRLKDEILNSKREARLINIQENKGSQNSISLGKDWVLKNIKKLKAQTKVPMKIDELIVGTICGGSDGTSGMSGNPAVGVAFDKLVKNKAKCIFEETGELIGCEHFMASRTENKNLAKNLITCVEKAAKYYKVMGYGSFASGNASGGLSTQEEKSLGAYAKSGSSEISGIIKPAQSPKESGLYLLDVVPDGEILWGFPNINDNSEIIELISCGAHIVVFVTGRGSVVGSAISPILKVCANPKTYENLEGDMDVNAGLIIKGEKNINEVGDEIYEKILSLASGKLSKSEALGHQEFVLGYKYFEKSKTCTLDL